jgi:dipeptidyl aminopeptidase/acylaminoacyl peptidase
LDLKYIVLRIVIVAFLALAILAVCSIAYRNYYGARLDFEPWPASPALRHPEQTGVANLQAIRFRTASGLQVAGWYVPSRNGAAVVLTHGTNSDRSSMATELRVLSDAGFGVLAFDWPGDGESQSDGRIRWGSVERNALSAALAWLGTRSDVDSARIGGLGFSMGGFVMTQVAAFDARLRSVVIEAAPPDFEEYLRRLHARWGFLSEWPAGRAVRDSGMVLHEMSPRNVVARIAPRPVLIIGGARDEIVSPAMIAELYSAAREPKSEWIVPNAHHGGYSEVAGVEYRQRLIDFFTATLAAR